MTQKNYLNRLKAKWAYINDSFYTKSLLRYGFG